MVIDKSDKRISSNHADLVFLKLQIKDIFFENLSLLHDVDKLHLGQSQRKVAVKLIKKQQRLKFRTKRYKRNVDVSIECFRHDFSHKIRISKFSIHEGPSLEKLAYCLYRLW